MTPAWRQVACPLCGPQAARPWRRHAGWRVVRCAHCGLLLTWPRPSAAQMEALYATPDYYRLHGMGPDAAEGWRERAAELLALVGGQPQQVCDFGAGAGHALAGFRALGLAVWGVEPSVAGRAQALERHGLTLAAELTDLADPPVGGFDLVTCIHSLEHVPDPLAVLEALDARLRPGGRLLIEVPHAGSWEVWTRRGRDRVLHLPAHLYHFTPRTLALLVRRAGLAPERVQLSNPDWLERALAWRLRQRARATPAKPVPQEAAPSAVSPPGARPASLWSRRVLPLLRRAFPGYKFQLVARRAP